MSKVVPRRILGPLIAAGLFCSMLAMLVFWVGLIWLGPGLVKLLVPIPSVRRASTRAMLWVVERWVASNARLYRFWLPVRWEVRLPPELDPRCSYLVICNHQSWADILIMFDILHDRVPWPRFFLKRSLLWVPIVGFVCWAMDFPFMRRQSRDGVDAAAARADLETTRRFCKRFRGEPITIVNFVEGTRSTAAKRAAKQSPYRYLLRPKSGGLSFTLNAMGEQFVGILDVTIAYQPSVRPTLVSFLYGEQPELMVDMQLLPIPPEWVSGDYQGDTAFRSRFQLWLNELWSRKDEMLAQRTAGF